MGNWEPEWVPLEDRIILGDEWQADFRVEGHAIVDATGEQVGEVVAETRFADTDEGPIQFEQLVAVYY